jgi:cyclic pyranopterin phosphate synthase
MADLTHVTPGGKARMVDVSAKDDTVRIASVTGGVRMKPQTLTKIRQNELKKGDVLAVARVAGVMAAKRTPDLIPLCHPILISDVDVEFEYAGKDKDNGSQAPAKPGWRWKRWWPHRSPH